MYFKKSRLKKAEICDGVMVIKLDVKRDIVYDKNGKPIAFKNPLFNVTLPLHSYYVIIHHQ